MLTFDGQIQRTTAERVAQGVSTVLALGPGAYLGWVWKELPARVPSHFGMNGQADRFSNPNALWFLPILSLVMFVVLTLLERVPQVYNYPFQITDANRETAYRVARQTVLGTKTCIAALFAYVTIAAVQTAVGHANGLGAWFVPAILCASPVGITVCVLRMSRAGKTR